MGAVVNQGLEAGQPAGTARAEPSLTSRVVKGAAWVFAGKLVGRGMDFARLVVLARLLSPDDFGLFGIVMLAIAVLESFSETGFNTALIQRKDNAQAYLDTAWTVQVIRRLMLALALFAGAPLVSWFFNEPRAVPLIRLMSASVALSGFVNIGIIYFQKELQFHKQVLYSLLTAVVSLIVGVVLAYKLRSVWALIWAGLAGTVAQCGLSYVLHPYRPRLRFSGAQARELFRFGRWMLGTSVLVYGGSQLDNLMVGKLLGTAALGFYAMAYKLSLLPLQETTYAVSGVLLAGYAKVQDQGARLRRAYERALALTAFFSVPACLGMALLARPGVRLVLGEKWLPAVVPIQILAIAQLVKSIISTGSPFFLGSGRPRYEFYAQTARVVGLVACLVPGILMFGLPGAAFAVLVSALAMFTVYLLCLGKVLDRPARLLGRAVIPFLAGGTVMTAGLAYAGLLLGHYSGPALNQALLLFAAVVAGGIVYLATCLGTSALCSESTFLADIRRLLLMFKRACAALRSRGADVRPETVESH